MAATDSVTLVKLFYWTLCFAEQSPMNLGSFVYSDIDFLELHH